MKYYKNIKRKLTAYLLLGLYLITISPTVFFHEHKSHIVAYNEATHCEKAIYYADKKEGCNHTQHISKASEKCLLCDNHVVSPHTTLNLFFSVAFDKPCIQYKAYLVSYPFYSILTASNKGPPNLA